MKQLFHYLGHIDTHSSFCFWSLLDHFNDHVDSERRANSDHQLVGSCYPFHRTYLLSLSVAHYNIIEAVIEAVGDNATVEDAEQWLMNSSIQKVIEIADDDMAADYEGVGKLIKSCQTLAIRGKLLRNMRYEED